MNSEIWTYQSFDEIIKLFADGKVSGKVIAATQTYSFFAGEAFNKKGIFKKPLEIIAINRLLRTIFKSWYSSEKGLAQAIALGDIIENCVSLERNVSLKQSFVSNKGEILKAIRMLTEAGVAPNSLHPGDNELLVAFKEIWQTFNDKTIEPDKILADFFQNWKKPETFVEILNNAIKDLRGTNYISSFKIGEPVFFLGFYFFNPLQKRLVDAIAAMGGKVIFLCNYDKTQPNTFRIWEKTYSEALNNAREVNPGLVSDRFWGEIFDDNQISYGKKVDIARYNDIFSFVNKVDEYNGIRASEQSGLCMFSPSNHDVQKSLRAFFPDQNAKKALLAYPIGQYLYNLYNMWDEGSHKIVPTVEIMKACLASGWAGLETASSTEYLSDFDKVSTYFSDCKTVEEWTARIVKLMETTDFLIAEFCGDIDNKETNSRWKRMTDNPFSSVSAFSCSPKRIEELGKIFENIFEDAQELFGTENFVALREHFAKIKKIIARKTAQRETVPEEKEVIRDLLIKLNSTPRFIENCKNSEIAEAMSMFLSGEFDEMQDGDFFDNGDEILDKSKIVVFGLNDIELAPHLYEGKKAMVCFVEDSVIPCGYSKFPWPLTKEIIQKISEESIENSGCYTKLLTENSENIVYVNRYLFYKIVHTPNVEISWVSEHNNKLHNPSVYINMLENIYDIKIKGNSESIIDAGMLEKDKNIYQDIMLSQITEQIAPAEIQFAKAICPWRWLYSFILQEFDGFAEPFHLNFLFRNIIAIISRISGNPVEMVATEVFEMFPSFRDSERAQIIDFAKRIKNSISLDKTDYDGTKYFKARHLLRLIDKKLYSYYTNGAVDDSEIPIQATKCKYCPHGNVCIEKHKRMEESNA